MMIALLLPELFSLTSLLFFPVLAINAFPKAKRTLRYVFVCSMIVLAVVFESSTLLNLEHTIAKMGEAGEWRSSSSTDQSEYNKLAAESAKELAEAERLRGISTELEERAEADRTRAESERKEAEKLLEEASMLETEISNLEVKAANDLKSYEDNTKIAKENAEEASLESWVDSVINGICHFLPFVDLVCDAVGSLAQISVNTARAADTDAALKAFAAAKEAKESRANKLASIAADLSKVEAETDKAHELEAAAKEDRKDADFIENEADEREVDAEKENKKANEIGERAREESEKAAREAAKANLIYREAMRQGLRACLDYAIVILSSLQVTVFFGSKLVREIILPAVEYARKEIFAPLICCAKVREGMNADHPSSWIRFVRPTLRFLIRNCVFVATLQLWVNFILRDCNLVRFNMVKRACSIQTVWNGFSLTDRGGLILFFGGVAGIIYCMLTSSLDFWRKWARLVTPSILAGDDKENRTSKEKDGRRPIIEFALSFLYNVPVFTMEVLIVILCYEGVLTKVASLYLFMPILFVTLLIFMVFYICWEDDKESFWTDNHQRCEESESLVDRRYFVEKSPDIIKGDGGETTPLVVGNRKDDETKPEVERELRAMYYETYLGLDFSDASSVSEKKFNEIGIKGDDDDETLPSSFAILKSVRELEPHFILLVLTVVFSIFRRGHTLKTWRSLALVMRYSISELTLATNENEVIALCIAAGATLVVGLCLWTKFFQFDSDPPSGDDNN